MTNGLSKPLYCEQEDCCFWEEEEINEGSDLPVLNCNYPNIGLRDISRSCQFYRLDWKKKQGFTLIEVLIVVGIISILATLGIVNLQKHLITAKQTATLAQIQNLEMAIERFKSDLRIYPDPYSYNDLPNSLYDWLTADPFKGISKSHPYYPYKGRWGGPYFPFNQKDFRSGGNFEKIEYYDGSEPQIIQDTRNEIQIIDQFEQPLIYIPSTSYAKYGGVVSDLTTGGETQYMNSLSFQLVSFGHDGKSLKAKMGGLSWHDNKDNDSDGLIDKDDNLKQVGKSSSNIFIEDDLNNF